MKPKRTPCILIALAPDNNSRGFEVGLKAHLDLSATMRESNEAGIQFVLTDLDLARTFLVYARTTHDPETAKRNQKNARTAHDAIARLLPKLSPTIKQSQTIKDQMNALRISLESMGETF